MASRWHNDDIEKTLWCGYKIRIRPQYKDIAFFESEFLVVMCCICRFVISQRQPNIKQWHWCALNWLIVLCCRKIFCWWCFAHFYSRVTIPDKPKWKGYRLVPRYGRPTRVDRLARPARAVHMYSPPVRAGKSANSCLIGDAGASPIKSAQQIWVHGHPAV